MYVTYKVYKLPVEFTSTSLNFVYFFSAPCDLLDVVFILDVSGSINNADVENFENIRTFVKAFASSFDVWGVSGVQMGVVLLGSSGVLAIQLNSYTELEAFTSAVDLIQFRNQKTNIQSALDVTTNMAFSAMLGARDNAYQVAILITDGEMQNPEFGPLEPARLSELRNSGVEVFVLASTEFVTSPVNAYVELGMIATDDDHYMSITDFGEDLIMELDPLLNTIATNCENQVDTSAGFGKHTISSEITSLLRQLHVSCMNRIAFSDVIRWHVDRILHVQRSQLQHHARH